MMRAVAFLLCIVATSLCGCAAPAPKEPTALEKEVAERQRELAQKEAQFAASTEAYQKQRLQDFLDKDQDAKRHQLENMDAQIASMVEQYNSLPRKKFMARPKEQRFVAYIEQLEAKLMLVGNANYPNEARGHLYGKVQLSLSINADGSLAGVDIERSSGYDVLDQAAMRIARMASPFAPFPEEIRRDTDILVFTRTLTFASSEKPDSAEQAAPAQARAKQNEDSSMNSSVAGGTRE